MSSSISGSDPGHKEDDARLAWQHWLAVFCGTFFGLSALLFALLLLIDPYDTGRFPGFGIVGIGDSTTRTADASRGRDPRFNATVIGSSTGQLLDPYRLSRETGLRFSQLTMAATGPQEQLTLMRWVISHHPDYGAFVIVTDPSWCSSDPGLPLSKPFPFWLYGSDLEYLAHLLNSRSLDRAAWRIEIALGMRQPVDPVGYFDYTKEIKHKFVPGLPGSSAKITNEHWSPPDLPWIDRLRAFLAGLPQSVRVVLVMPPVYFTLLAEPGSKQAADLDACKAALTNAVPDRQGSGFLDFRLDTEAAHDAVRFADALHSGHGLTRQMEDAIIALLRSDQVGLNPSRGDAAWTTPPSGRYRGRSWKAEQVLDTTP
jgi:hypothetical protein